MMTALSKSQKLILSIFDPLHHPAIPSKPNSRTKHYVAKLLYCFCGRCQQFCRPICHIAFSDVTRNFRPPLCSFPYCFFRCLPTPPVPIAIPRYLPNPVVVQNTMSPIFLSHNCSHHPPLLSLIAISYKPNTRNIF